MSFLDEFKAAGFSSASLLRAIRNTRTNNPKALAAEIKVTR